MKLLKALIITVMSLLLTGCYTQLQYSQTMKKITDEEQTSDKPVYSWSGEEEAEASKDKAAEAEYDKEQDEYIPVYYKDYEYATKYGDVYNFYGNDWYGYNPYVGSRFHSWYPYSYDRWAYHSFYGRWYDRPHYGFSISLSWGWPSYYYGYYDPFFDPYYDYYWYRYYSRYAFNYNYFYRKSGYGYGYWPDSKKTANNTRYGPRTIGTNRVDTDGNRSRSVGGDRAAKVTNRTSSNTLRTRSVGTTRTRGTTSSGTTVKRAKRNNNSSSGRSRTRGQNQINNNQVDRIDYRSRGDELPLVIDEKRLEQFRTRINSDRNSALKRSRLTNNTRDDKPTFFNRMRSFFQQSTGTISNGNSGRTLRTRSNASSSSRSKINRKSSSNNRSSVTRSKSSSSNSRSRGSSSSSRSRSDNSGSSSSSSSDRSRGN